MLLYVAAPMCWKFFFNIIGKYTLQEDYNIWIGRKQARLSHNVATIGSPTYDTMI